MKEDPGHFDSGVERGVGPVPDHGMGDGSQVNPYLMSSSGVEADLQQGHLVIGIFGDDLVMGDRRLSSRDDRATRGTGGVASDRRIDRPGWNREETMDQRQIGSSDSPCGQV